jgi:hypothetical protein
MILAAAIVVIAAAGARHPDHSYIALLLCGLGLVGIARRLPKLQ